MPGNQVIVCACGGKLFLPLPRRCPHCGAEIAGVRTLWWTWIVPWLFMAAMLGLVVAFLLYMTRG